MFINNSNLHFEPSTQRSYSPCIILELSSLDVGRFGVILGSPRMSKPISFRRFWDGEVNTPQFHRIRFQQLILNILSCTSLTSCRAINLTSSCPVGRAGDLLHKGRYPPPSASYRGWTPGVQHLVFLRDWSQTSSPNLYTKNHLKRYKIRKSKFPLFRKSDTGINWF